MRTMRRTASGFLTIGAIALFAAACGGSSSGGGNASVNTAAGGAAGGSAAAVTTHSGPDGAYLTDSDGRTLYIFSKDKGATSTCTGDCAKEWPPFTTSGSPAASGSADDGMLGTSDRGGATQVTYDGHPLYYFADDKSAGDMKGQGEDDFGGLWTAVTPDGSPLTTATSSSEPSSGDSSSPEWG